MRCWSQWVLLAEVELGCQINVMASYKPLPPASLWLAPELWWPCSGWP